jgi:hypothetical protein
MRTNVLGVTFVLAVMATTAACTGSGSGSPAPTTPADETAAVCAEAAAQARESSRTISRLIGDLTVARVNADPQGQTTAGTRIAEAARTWAVSLSRYTDRQLRPGVKEAFEEQVDRLDGLTDAAATHPGSLNAGNVANAVELIAKNVYWTCGYSPDGELTGSSQNPGQ